MRPNAVSSGGLLWHTVHASPVCRVKLGTACASGHNVTKKTRRTRPLVRARPNAVRLIRIVTGPVCWICNVVPWDRSDADAIGAGTQCCTSSGYSDIAPGSAAGPDAARNRDNGSGRTGCSSARATPATLTQGMSKRRQKRILSKSATLAGTQGMSFDSVLIFTALDCVSRLASDAGEDSPSWLTLTAL